MCLQKLGFGLTGDADKFTVSVPRRRWDISIQADLVEEIARIYGYEKIAYDTSRGSRNSW